MYNAELKEQYLTESEYRNLTLRYSMTSRFNKIEKTEERLGKDLSNFTVNEIIDYYKSLCFTSFETINMLNSQFKIYTNYCLNRHLVVDNQNHYCEINNDIILSCVNIGLINEKIVTRKDLLHIMSQLYNPSEKFLVLALFEGICGKNMCELLDLKYEDFHDGKVYLCTGRELEVSDELVNLAKLSSETYEYVAYNNSGKEKEYSFDKSDPNILKKLYNCSSEDDIRKRQRLYNKIIRMRSYLGANCISNLALNESGRIHKVIELCAQENIPFKECLMKHKELDYIYGRVYSYSTYMLKYGEIIERMM